MPMPNVPFDETHIVFDTGHTQEHNEISEALNYLGSDSQAANLIFSTPSGAPGAGDFRALTGVDIDAALRSIPVGSVGTPSLAFTGDPNTGYYWVSADRLGISAGGVTVAQHWLAGTGERILIVGDGANIAQLYFNGATSTVRDFIYQTNGVARFILRVDGSVESGANAGSNFIFLRRADGGGALGTVFYVDRATGRIGINTTTPVEILDVVGNIQIKNVGGKFLIKEGSNASLGAATLIGGTVTVANTMVTANSRIFLTTNTPGGVPGWLQVSARINATSFTILSSSVADISVVSWLIIEPAP